MSDTDADTYNIFWNNIRKYNSDSSLLFFYNGNKTNCKNLVRWKLF